MRERPILFKGPLVRAILDGTKTQTRRLCKPDHFGGSEMPPDSAMARAIEFGGQKSPFGRPGDRLWVRETWQAWPVNVSEFDDSGPLSTESIRDRVPAHFEYQAGPTDSLGPWRPSIHMPRRASRIDLEITEVRVQRLQDITEEDARAECVDPMPGPVDVVDCGNGHGYFDPAPPARCVFEELWDSINGARAPWERNPWVWAITFKRIRP